jgi:parvulin-like peptidyl-prolyl isomerase
MNARYLLPLAGLVALTACADLTEPYSTGGPGGANTGAATAENAPAPAPTPAPAPAPAPQPQPAAEQSISASHILIAYKGAMRAKPDVTRTKIQARQLATRIDARAKQGEDFATLAKKYSDGPSGPRGGALGSFTRGRMVKPFSDAAFALKPGGVSGVVETPFGFHIIKRTQ